MHLCRGSPLVIRAHRSVSCRTPLIRALAHGRLRQPIMAVNQQEDKKEKAPPSAPPPNKGKPDPDQAKLEAVIQQLKNSGMTTNKAKKLLSLWAKAGVQDPEQLRKLLVQRSLQPFTGALFQAAIDGIACFGGFYLAYIVGQSEDVPFKILLELIGNFAGLYYFINLVLTLGVVSAIAYSTFRYGTSSTEVLAAVRQLAGPTTGLTIVDKAAVVVNTLKVLQALEEVAKMMQEQYGDASTSSSGTARDSLKNLSALLTLSRAKEELGFRAEDFGLSEKQAGNIAYAFSVYDVNDNGRLELPEVGSLCSSLGWTLEEEELKEAYKTLDKDKNGYIDFKEFVEWWCMKSPVKP